MKRISLSVKQFALPCPRVGSIETHSGYGPTPTTGQEIHQAVQRQRLKENSNYVSEKKINYSFLSGPYEFFVSGRTDGFVEEPALIEEIKSAFDVDELYRKMRSEPDHPYIWQLRTYGYMYFKSTGVLPKLHLHLVSSRNFKSHSINVELDVDAYEFWLGLRLKELLEETKIKEKLFKKRLSMSGEMTFPFSSPRKGQKELVESISQSFSAGESLLVQAPTGLGKTAGILYPALKESLSRGQKVIYVTPKNSQHQVAEEAVEKIQEQGCQIRSLTITAKSKMCLKNEPLCNPKYCEYAKDYYSKVATHGLMAKMSKMRRLDSEKLQKMGQDFEVCPFELSVEAIEQADVVIGDYNYVFAPRSLLARLTEPLLEADQKANLVIDEAHNLPSRSQDYFSPTLSTLQLTLLEKDFVKLPASYTLQAQSLTNRARRLIQSYGVHGVSKIIHVEFEPILDLEKDIRELTTEYLDSDVEILPQDPILRLMNLWTDFTSAIQFSGEEFFQTYQKQNHHEMIKITCCDASEHLKLAYEAFKNVVAFSATLKPFRYYQELLGFSESCKQVEFQSPFAKHHRKILVIPQISTKFSDRQGSSGKIAETIQRISSVKPGNYMALFPSFEFMRMTHEKLSLPNFKILLQEKEMKQIQIQDYLEEMKQAQTPILLLGVQGGVFSEGVDFPGDMLIGAFVVGPALPNFDFEREQIRSYYEKRYGKEHAFNYAYVYPAMAKAIQSAGRVIRSENDRGVIVMMDARFLQSSYFETMPEGWFDSSPQELVSKQILNDLRFFWENHGA